MFFREHLNEEYGELTRCLATTLTHLRADEPCNRFGIKPSSASNKAKQIRDWFDMMPLDPDWCLPSRIDRNPLAWAIEVDDLFVDARNPGRDLPAWADTVRPG